MSPRTGFVWRGLAVVALSAAGWYLTVDPSRRAEARIVVHILTGLGFPKTSAVVPNCILIFPEHGRPMCAVVTRSCTSAGPVLALLGIGVFVFSAPFPRRLLAVCVALAVVVLGNLSRISFSAMCGIWWGRRALVLFHDIVGTAMGYLFTMGGLMVILGILMPGRRRSEELHGAV